MLASRARAAVRPQRKVAIDHEEELAHAAHVASLGADAIWLRYATPA
jgi:hypothetical protein